MTDGKDASGGPTETASTVATVWGSVSPLVGRERFAAQQVDADVDHEIRIRYRGDLTFTPKHRISFGTRVFDIRAVMNKDERNREWRILATEKV